MIKIIQKVFIFALRALNILRDARLYLHLIQANKSPLLDDEIQLLSGLLSNPLLPLEPREKRPETNSCRDTLSGDF